MAAVALVTCVSHMSYYIMGEGAAVNEQTVLLKRMVSSLSNSSR